ncbi:hypothetical protein OB919_07780 [Halobacteria archaeon AArc-curdl1]|uniref:Uncharacterized protein n=1 Tax=Natronosalvus hydrolyticus TaxID=2979988 RepID=A0AAP2Z7C2_9EURY|nr:hypothetical protein [Halobacteria archaeon AArc-curdl1]
MPRREHPSNVRSAIEATALQVDGTVSGRQMGVRAQRGERP